MQSTLYTVQFVSPLDDQFAAGPRAVTGTWMSWILQNSQKKWVLPAQPTSIHKLSMPSMVWNISAGLAAWPCSLPAPACLLISWIWETGRSPWFLGNSWKPQCYQHSSHTKSKTQQLLRGKLTLSQPKPGQRPPVKSVGMPCIACTEPLVWGEGDVLFRFSNVYVKNQSSELIACVSVSNTGISFVAE